MRWFGKYIPRGSVVLAVTTFGSYILGLLRDRTFAQTFGASASLDSYNAAFLIPDLAFNVLVASGIAAAVVPLFIQLRATNQRQAHVYINSMMTIAVIVMGMMGVIIYIAAPWLSHLVAPGLDANEHILVAELMRILALSPILFAASNALGALLVAQQRFFFYGLSPLLYNIGIIAGSLYLAPYLGIKGVAYGTVFGALLHLTARVVAAWRSGWRPVPLLQVPIPRLGETLRLIGPKMLGHPVELVTFWAFTSLASLMSAGSISILNFARNFQSVPVSILGIAMATAVFPDLARAALASPTQVRLLVRRTALSIFLASSAAAVGLFGIRHQLVTILLGGGAFDEAAIRRTALVLGVFCLAIPTESLSHLLARAFYATKNTAIPVLWSIISLLVAVSSAYGLSHTIGIVALPIGFFLGSLGKVVGLWITLHIRLTPVRAAIPQ